MCYSYKHLLMSVFSVVLCEHCQAWHWCLVLFFSGTVSSFFVMSILYKLLIVANDLFSSLVKHGIASVLHVEKH